MEKLIIPNKKGGIVTGVIWGIGGLIIASILIFVVVATLNNANLITDQSVSWPVVNETVNTETDSIMNIANRPATALYFTGWNNSIVVINRTLGFGTGYYKNNTLVEGTDYTINATTGEILNKTTGWNSSYISYTWVESITHLNYAVDNLTTNFSSGVNEVAEKIPTILLIVAVIFLFGALVLLVRYASGMGVFGSGAGSL